MRRKAVSVRSSNLMICVMSVVPLCRGTLVSVVVSVSFGHLSSLIPRQSVKEPSDVRYHFSQCSRVTLMIRSCFGGFFGCTFRISQIVDSVFDSVELSDDLTELSNNMIPKEENPYHYKKNNKNSKFHISQILSRQGVSVKFQSTRTYSMIEFVRKHVFRGKSTRN